MSIEKKFIRHTSLIFVIKEILRLQEEGYKVDINSSREFGIGKQVTMYKEVEDFTVSADSSKESPIVPNNSGDEKVSEGNDTDATTSNPYNESGSDSNSTKDGGMSETIQQKPKTTRSKSNKSTPSA